MDQEFSPEIIAQAKQLYDAVWRYYMFKVDCIKPADYELMQQVIGYKQSYEAYMATVVQGIPCDTWVMIQQIARFIVQYVEFQEPKYVAKIRENLHKIEGDRELYKRKAFEILVKLNAEDAAQDDLEGELDASEAVSEAARNMIGFHPPLFELDLGVGGQKLVLPTYGNPMMTSLYSLLFMSFQHFQMEDMDMSIPSGQ